MNETGLTYSPDCIYLLFSRLIPSPVNLETSDLPNIMVLS